MKKNNSVEVVDWKKLLDYKPTGGKFIPCFPSSNLPEGVGKTEGEKKRAACFFCPVLGC